MGRPKKRGPAPQRRDPRDEKIADLERDRDRWRARAERAEQLLEVQRTLTELLGTPLETTRS